MPQLDITLFAHEAAMTAIYFIILYYIVSFLIIPQVFFVLFARKELFIYMNFSFKKFVIKFILLWAWFDLAAKYFENQLIDLIPTYVEKIVQLAKNIAQVWYYVMLLSTVNLFCAS